MNDEDEKLAQAAGQLGRERWANVKPEERSAHMKQLRAKRSNAPGGRSGGRPRKKKRCFCGATAWKTAKFRKFRCCRQAGLYPALEKTK